MDSTADANRSSTTVLLESIIPGYSLIRAFFMIFHIDITKYVAGIAIIVGVLAGFRYLYSMLGDSLLSYFVSSAEISAEDELYNFFMAWLARQTFAKSARQFVASVSTNSTWIWDQQYFRDGEQEGEIDNADISLYTEEDPRFWRDITSKGKVAPMYFTPGLGTSFFRYKGRFIVLTRQEERTNGLFRSNPRYSVFISCFGWDTQVLKELLDEVRQSYFVKDMEKTVIYRGGTANGSAQWTRCMARSIRPLDTVVLAEDQKHALINDMKDYLHPSTRRFYASRGIPYRRGYLLYGPPGTGKSSLSFALAGIFGLQLYIINLNSRIDEQDLARLFETLPQQCLVLLEDIDTAGIDKRADSNAKDDTPNTSSVPDDVAKQVNKDQKPPKISLSALLNVIDGVASHEGRVLVMTTNHLEKLDEALIRPGRIDMSIEFKNADESAVCSLFRGMYATDSTDNLSLSSVSDGKTTPGKEHLSEKEIALLSQDLAKMIPPSEFSPAEIQGFLLKHKHDPQQALTNCPEWVEETRLKKQKEPEPKPKKKGTRHLKAFLNKDWKKLRGMNKILQTKR